MSVAKLKESIQEVIVFLRTLGDFKIPAVIERRRKELLQHLLELQGEPSRDKSKSLETAAAEKEKETPKTAEKVEKVKKSEPPPEKTVKDEEEPEKPKSPTKSPTKRLERRDSKLVSGLIGNFENIQKTAKEAEMAETPKRLVTLRKVAKPQDFPDAENNEVAKDKEPLETSTVEIKEPTPAPEEEVPDKGAPQVTLRPKDNGELKPERPSSATSIESHDLTNVTEEDKGGKKKKKIKLGIFKKGKRDKSPAPAPVPAAAETPANGEEIEGEKSGGSEVEEVEEPQEEGVKLVMTLERKSRTAFGHKWIKQEVKLKESSLYAGDKEMSLSGCKVIPTDTGFEVSHPEQKNMHFKVEGDEAKNQWVTALNETIEQCSPEEEKVVPEETQENGKTPEGVPNITVEEPLPEEHVTPSKKRKESKVSSLKPTAQNKLPDHGVEMKGYIYRKKPGLGNRWDKTYCIITYQAVYFTTVDDNKEYNHMLPLSSDITGSVSPRKGHDKSSQGLSLKVGKKSEHLSIESKSEFDQWMAALERVLGIGGVEELLSEDEGLDEAPDVGGEELYEELELDDPPPVPHSPRPVRAPIPEPQDDIIIDEDIYEDTDGLDLPEDLRVQVQQQSYHQEKAPVLPDRNQPKKDASPAPNLPPRNAPAAPVPSLPPRNSPQPSKKAVEPPKSVVPGPQRSSAMGPKKAPAPPPPAAEEEDFYDDVVVADKVEDDQEMYEDVIVPSGQDGIEEELYDDVVTATTVEEPITEEFYEDMTPGTAEEPQEDYVIMEHGQEDVEQDLYVDVEEPTAFIKVNSSPKPSASPKLTTKASSTFTRMFGQKGAKTQLHSGALSYKGPKKSSKFEVKWGVIEGNILQIFKTSSDKRSQEKLSLSDYGLDSGSPETGAGEFAFRLTKGDKVHHFSVKTQEDMQGWVDVLKGLTKYAAVTMIQPSEEETQVYQASEDHIADADEELTFKKGTYLKLIKKESDGMWFGQIGNEEQVFEGKKGKFPASKVIVAEDLYF